MIIKFWINKLIFLLEILKFVMQLTFNKSLSKINNLKCAIFFLNFLNNVYI